MMRGNKRGYFQAVCRLAAKVAGIHTPARQTSCNSYDVLLRVLASSDESEAPWAVTLTLEGKPTTLSVDTGAKVTVISDHVWKDIEQPNLTDMKPERPHPVQREVFWYTSISRLKNTRGGLSCPWTDEAHSRSPYYQSAASHPKTHKRMQGKWLQRAVPISVLRTREAEKTQIRSSYRKTQSYSHSQPSAGWRYSYFSQSVKS